MTNLPTSDSEATSFLSLHPLIQRWIWAQGWTTLRSIQEHAIDPLLAGDSDVILAAATSAGKTEAAFFPLLTRLLKEESQIGFILSISPLKALINDQADRLTALCEELDLPVLGWHGDVSDTKKQRFLKQMRGVLIITPESLESLFVNKGTLIPTFASRVRSIVIDELHSFIGTERGKQVQSLMNRLDIASGVPVARVGLSATLGDKSLAAAFLRPNPGKEVVTIDTGSESYGLKLVVRGYLNSGSVKGDAPVPESPSGATEERFSEENDEEQAKKHAGFAAYEIADYLYRQLRGTNNLVFPNSRSNVEFYADQLRRRCERERVPNEFWTHHGNLSRDIREEAEAALKTGTTAATAICTSTLELGIDIGHIRNVVQIGPAPSVASLRQRLGRSGRRAGEAAILRCLCIEQKLTPDAALSDRLREGLVQNIAMVRLLLASWVEPPRRDALHASTFVQQLLSVIAQRGGASAAELWTDLVRSGTFNQITMAEFSELLRALGTRDILLQESSGLLLPGVLGEKLINSFEFYSAFTSGEEFRIVAEGRPLGSLPVSRALTVGQRLIFAGRRWRVLKIETAEKVILVSADAGGIAPSFDGAAGRVHDRVRQEMKRVLSDVDSIPFVDAVAANMLAEARASFHSLRLGTESIRDEGAGTFVFTWHGDWINDTLALLMTAKGCPTSNEGIALRVSSVKPNRVRELLTEIVQQAAPSIADLRANPKHFIREKWDWVLPETLLLRSFASAELDLKQVQAAAARLVLRDD